MSLPGLLQDRLRLPLIGAPMFIVSQPPLVIAQCKAGIVGSFPALNARPEELLEEWLKDIKSALAEHDAAHPERLSAPYAVNQIVHASNARLQHDLDVCVKHEAPIIITSLRPPGDVVEAVHSYGGVVFHDVISIRHARKAIEQGVDGIIAVCAGAGGHAGTLSPFALVKEIRKEFDGTILLSGSMSNGGDILAAQAIGADLAYFGTRFIATDEAHAPSAYKQMIVDSKAADIVYTPYFSGVKGNYLRDSIEKAGIDPDELQAMEARQMDFAARDKKSAAKAWKDIWSAGQGVGAVDEIMPTARLVDRIAAEYEAARQRLKVA